MKCEQSGCKISPGTNKLRLRVFAASVRVAADGGANRLLIAERRAKDHASPEVTASLNNVLVSISTRGRVRLARHGRHAVRLRSTHAKIYFCIFLYMITGKG